jgi:hypothetical protein
MAAGSLSLYTKAGPPGNRVRGAQNEMRRRGFLRLDSRKNFSRECAGIRA